VRISVLLTIRPTGHGAHVRTTIARRTVTIRSRR
jgi:hypothetical protein